MTELERGDQLASQLRKLASYAMAYADMHCYVPNAIQPGEEIIGMPQTLADVIAESEALVDTR